MHPNPTKARGEVQDAELPTETKQTEAVSDRKSSNSLDIYINLPFNSILGGYLAGPLWLGPAPAPSGPAARGARWQRARRPSSLPGSPPGLYSTCPSSAAAGSPPPGAGPPPHAAGLQTRKRAVSKGASQPTCWAQHMESILRPYYFFAGHVTWLAVVPSLPPQTLNWISVSRKAFWPPNFGSEQRVSGREDEPPAKWWNRNVKDVIRRKAKRKKKPGKWSVITPSCS